MQPTNYANPASPLSPPTVGIPTNTSGLILSPNKAPTVTILPTPKQFPAVPTGHPPPQPSPSVAPITPTYHNKMALPPPYPPPTRHTHPNIYHHYSSPPPLQPAAVLAPPPPANAVIKTSPIAIRKTPPKIEQPLLAIDTSHKVERNALKTNTKLTNSSSIHAPSLPTVTGKPVVVANEATKSTTTATNMNGTTPIVTNHCVELYTS